MINNLGLYNITIDFDKMLPHATTNIYFKKGDINTSKIRATLIKGENKVNLTGITISIKIETMVDSIVGSATIIDAENGIIEYVFPTNALIEGVNFFELILVEGENVKESSRFVYKVLDNIDDDGLVAEETNYPILIQLISDTNTIINNANQSIVDIEDKITEVENRCAIKENAVNSKIAEVNTTITNVNAAKDDTIIATNNAIAKTTEANNKIIEVENRFELLTASQQQDAEVINSRKNLSGVVFNSLNERLNNIETQPSIIWETVEG